MDAIGPLIHAYRRFETTDVLCFFYEPPCVVFARLSSDKAACELDGLMAPKYGRWWG